MKRSEGYIPPSDRLISSLDGVYYKLTEVADILDVSPAKLRRLLKESGIKAPSQQVWQGGMKVYLYTEGDLAELKDYFANSVRVENRRES